MTNEEEKLIYGGAVNCGKTFSVYIFLKNHVSKMNRKKKIITSKKYFYEMGELSKR